MTITDLLLTPFYRGNQTLLAKELKINRGTLRKYMLDKSGESHIIRKQYGEYVLFGKVTKDDK
jgi:hypothetical protein